MPRYLEMIGGEACERSWKASQSLETEGSR
jgi:hypothetical protein